MERLSEVTRREGRCSSTGTTAGASPVRPLPKKLCDCAITSSWDVLPATLTTMLSARYQVSSQDRKSCRCISDTVSSVPVVDQPRG